MQKNAFSRLLLIISLFALASCAMTEKYFPTHSEYNTLIVKADSAMREGTWAKAASLYEEAAYLKPDELDVKLKQAEAYQNDGKLAQAFNVYQLIIDSKAQPSASNDYAKKQAKVLQAKSGFKVEPLPAVPEAKSAQDEKPAGEQVSKEHGLKVPAVIPSVNADTTPAPAVEPQKLVTMDANKAVLDLLSGWREAWVSKKPSAYYAYYVEDFAGDAASTSAWRQQRKAKIMAAKHIKVTLSDVEVKVISDVLAEVAFKQVYQSGGYKDSGNKTMQLKKLQDRWLISQESFK